MFDAKQVLINIDMTVTKKSDTIRSYLNDQLLSLAQRLDDAMDSDIDDTVLDFDTVAEILRALANGTPADVIADGLDLPAVTEEMG